LTPDEQTTDAAPWHKLSWPLARWAKKSSSHEPLARMH